MGKELNVLPSNRDWPTKHSLARPRQCKITNAATILFILQSEAILSARFSAALATGVKVDPNRPTYVNDVH